MTSTEKLLQRVTSLEERVEHLTTHHDEQFLLVHDDNSADTCERLFNVNLGKYQQRANPPRQPRPRAQQRPKPKRR